MRKIKFRGMRKDNHLWEHGHWQTSASIHLLRGSCAIAAYRVFPSFADWVVKIIGNIYENPELLEE